MTAEREGAEVEALVRAMQPAMGDECTLDELRAYAARLAPLIAEHARVAAEWAWDEGHQRGLRDAELQDVADNPYRAAAHEDVNRGARLYIETLRGMNPSPKVAAVLDEIEAEMNEGERP